MLFLVPHNEIRPKKRSKFILFFNYIYFSCKPADDRFKPLLAATKLPLRLLATAWLSARILADGSCRVVSAGAWQL